MVALEPDQRIALQHVYALLRHKSACKQTHMAEDDLYALCRAAVQEARTGPYADAPTGRIQHPTVATAGAVLAAAIVQTYLARGCPYMMGHKQRGGPTGLGGWHRRRLLSLRGVTQSVAAMLEDARPAPADHARSAPADHARSVPADDAFPAPLDEARPGPVDASRLR